MDAIISPLLHIVQRSRCLLDAERVSDGLKSLQQGRWESFTSFSCHTETNHKQTSPPVAPQQVNLTNNQPITCRSIGLLIYTIQSFSSINLWSLILNLPQPSNSTPHSHSTRRTQTISTSSNSLFTTSTRPNSHNRSLDTVLTAEGTAVCGVLGDFDFAEELTEGGSVACSVFAGDADLSCALSHVCKWSEYKMLYWCWKRERLG